jgi:hypothetical protein
MRSYSRRSRLEVKKCFLTEVILELRKKIVGIDLAEKGRKTIESNMCKDPVARRSIINKTGRKKA